MQTMRKTGTKIFFWVLLLLLLAGLLTGCGTNDQENSADGQSVLRYGSGDYTAINPALYEHGEINALLFAGLTAHNEKNEVVPGLAEDWSFDEKTCTYTFSLRDGLTFHDGEPLTSADVKFTLEAILDEQNGSEIVSNYTDIAEIRCPDALTVEIRLTQPNAAFPDYMTIGILPEHLLAGKDLATCAFNQNPVGAGPYRLKDWDMGQSITMERFDNYYGGQPQIEQVIFVIVPDSDARAMQLAAGKIDMAQITPKSAEQFADSKEIRVYRMETADYRAIAYNFANPYFERHPELANILSYAIDREAIISGVLLGQGAAAYSPLQKSAYNNADIEHFTYDPEKAERLLVEAGWSKGADGYYEKDGERLGFTIAAMADDQVRVDMAAMCASQLQQIGADVSAETRQSLDWAGQEACIIGWGSPFDPDDHTYKVFTTGAGDNYTSYSNAAIDQILAAARHTEDAAEREKLYLEFQDKLTAHLPYTFIAYVDADYAMKANIHGITEDTVLGHHGVGIFWNIAQWRIA